MHEPTHRVNRNWEKLTLLVDPTKSMPLHKAHMQQSQQEEFRDKSISKLVDHAEYTSVKMVELGHLTWLSVKMAVKSPDLSPNDSVLMLHGKDMFCFVLFLSCKVLNILTGETWRHDCPVA